jgi:hypothetical protein
MMMTDDMIGYAYMTCLTETASTRLSDTVGVC